MTEVYTKADIMRCYSGSIAYGTNLPTSDVDIRGLFCAPKKSILTPYFPLKEQTLVNEEDGKIYELTNFFKLFTDMNPNIIELMFVDESDILYSTEVYEYLRKECPSLLSKKVAFTFSGYAIAQLKRIKGHDKWINNPQAVNAPTQMGFMRLVFNYTVDNLTKHNAFMAELQNLNDSCILMPYGNDIYAVMLYMESPRMFNGDGSIRKVDYNSLSDEVKKGKPLMVVKYLAEDHKQAKEKHKNYWTWKAERNEARHQLEVNFGYDTKHAMHLVRLMRMAEEILLTGQVIVKRPDAKELLEIRNGKWSLEELLKWAEEKDLYIRNDLYHTSNVLPHKTDIHHAAEVLMKAQQMCWSK